MLSKPFHPASAALSRTPRPLSQSDEEQHPEVQASVGRGRAATRLAGITDLHWHDLPHTFGTRLAEAECSEATIAELMGHTDPKTTRRYTHRTDRTKREAVEPLRLRTQAVCHNPATNDKQPPMLWL